MSDRYEITTLDDLLALYGATNPNSLAKEAPCLTAAYRAWLEQARFFTLATAGANTGSDTEKGGLDCSPRGDAAGQAFRILDDKTLAIPDRRGNNRLDSLRNLIVDPRLALLFLIPGVKETLRINGRARITRDPALLESFQMAGTLPTTVILVTVESVYFQCARALTRAALWAPVGQAGQGEVPTAGQMTKSTSPDFDAEGYDSALAARQKATLY